MTHNAAISQHSFEKLLSAVAERKQLMMDYLLQERFAQRFRPDHIRSAVYSYVKSGGKSLRPAVAMLACGAVAEMNPRHIPFASAIEIYHTWTLVHDDVIDKDSTRRGVPTVHTEYAQKARDEFGGLAQMQTIMAQRLQCSLVMCNKRGRGR